MLTDALSIDFETRSTVDLRKTSVYVYAAHPTTEILCMAYAFGDGPVGVWVPEQPVPAEIQEHVLAGKPMRAYNAMFERIMWRTVLVRHGFACPALEQWYCTAAEAAAMALPRGLGKAARAVNLPVQKDDEGHRLMLQTCKPRSVEETDLGEEIIWWDDDERMGRLLDYCIRDVDTERALAKVLRRLGPHEREVYLLDQRANDRGIRVDLDLVVALQKIVKRGQKEANARLKEVTGGAVTAVTKVADLTAWLQEMGADADNIQKATVRDLLEDPDTLDPAVVEALEIRQEAAKSSTAKLNSMVRYASADSRVRGMLLYHGAGTGRWTAKGPQPHNFPRGEIKGIERYIDAVLAGDFDGIAAEHPPLVVASSMLRSCLTANPGRDFVAGDYSQIEARILGWYAGEPYGKQEYERMAAAIYQVPVEEIENPSERRTVGKNTVLGAGFQMGAETYAAQIHKQTGIRVPEELAERAIQTYRSLKPGVVQFWYDIEAAAMDAVSTPGQITHVGVGGQCRFVVRGNFLWCILPSGRPLAYALPRVAERMTKWGPKIGLQFTGVNGYTKRWETRHAYGGFLTENVVQATARDLMAQAMLRLDASGYPVVLTVHDEIVTEPRQKFGSVEEFTQIMAAVPAWLEGCPVEVEAWRGPRYRK